MAKKAAPVGTVHIDKDGYRIIKVADTGQRSDWQREHRVIKEQELGRPLLRNELVHHENEVHGHNVEDNLSVVTRAEHNAIHLLGEQHWSAKLNDESVMQILVAHSKGVSQGRLAKKYQVSKGTISYIVLGKTWKNVYKAFYASTQA